MACIVILSITFTLLSFLFFSFRAFLERITTTVCIPMMSNSSMVFSTPRQGVIIIALFFIIMDGLTSLLIHFFCNCFLLSSVSVYLIICHSKPKLQGLICICFCLLRGRVAYQLTLSLWRLLCLCYYAEARMEVLKLTKHPEDGSIKARWRIKGLPFHSLLLRFYKKDKTQLYR